MTDEFALYTFMMGFRQLYSPSACVQKLRGAVSYA